MKMGVSFMKKVLLVLFSTMLILLMLNGCEKSPADETEKFFFYGYAVDTAVPDFLTESQQQLYKEALSLYQLRLMPEEIDNIKYFPLIEGQEYIAPREGDWIPDLTTENGSYSKSIGRYRKWADFEKLTMAVFTKEAYNELNKGNTWTEKDGDLYWLGALGVPRQCYSPNLKHDTFKLISSSDSEIKFTVTGYFYDDYDITKEESSFTSDEIILTKTKDGWRFSQFNTVW